MDQRTLQPGQRELPPEQAGPLLGLHANVSPLLTGATVTATARVRAASAALSDELAAQQRRHAAADAAIKPASFRAPSLASLRAAGARAGVDVERWLARH